MQSLIERLIFDTVAINPFRSGQILDTADWSMTNTRMLSLIIIIITMLGWRRDHHQPTLPQENRTHA